MPATNDSADDKGAWREVFLQGKALYTLLVLGGVAMHSLQLLVIAIVMPSVVADIGGATFYTWTAMLYTIGAIVGASSTGPLWERFGARRTYVIAACLLTVGTLGCATAENIGWLIGARAVQGWAGGLITGSGFALITSVFEQRLRTRVLALAQGTFTVSHLAGPAVGGYLAAVDWWRGSFWVMVPLMVLFAVIAWWRIPDELAKRDASEPAPTFPFFRLATLALGVCAVAATGPIEGAIPRFLLILIAVGLVTFAFKRDRAAINKMFPNDTLSFTRPVGLALWILALHAMGLTSLMIFLPLLLQVVHGVSPIWISYATILLSICWTISAFSVAGLSGRLERLVMMMGPIVVLVSLVAITLVARMPDLTLLTIFAATFGLGIGAYNGHLVARAMEAAQPGEQRTIAGALTSSRSLGTAFGAAIAGVIAHSGGLGSATIPAAVGHSVTLVMAASCIPIACAAYFMLRFLAATSPGAALGQHAGESLPGSKAGIRK